MSRKENHVWLCACCYKETPKGDLQAPRCAERPELRLQSGWPSIYRCPDCGALVMAGHQHPDLCKDCNPTRLRRRVPRNFVAKAAAIIRLREE